MDMGDIIFMGMELLSYPWLQGIIKSKYVVGDQWANGMIDL